jgi:small subunit ribosomal protein S18
MSDQQTEVIATAIEATAGEAEPEAAGKTEVETGRSERRPYGRGGRPFNKDREGNREYRGDRNDEERRGGRGGKGFFKKKVCRFCTQKLKVDYKEPDTLRRFVTERGKILPRRITGTCSKHQRVVSEAIKRARILALLPFAAE